MTLRASAVFEILGTSRLARMLLSLIVIGSAQGACSGSRPPAGSRQGLVEAVGDRRFFEPRLTGGFRFGPIVRPPAATAPSAAGVVRGAPSAAGGAGARGDWPVLAAAARLRESAGSPRSARELGDLAAAHLLVGDSTEAADLLSRAAMASRSGGVADARILSDLAAAYLVRASRDNRADDVPRAIEAASEALEIDPSLPEAAFNKGLALEELRLDRRAEAAWLTATVIETENGWREEARRRLDAISRLPRVDHDAAERAVAEALGSTDQRRIDEAVRSNVTLARDLFDMKLLSDPARREAAQRLASAFARATGDAYQVRALASLSGPDRFATFASARRHYDEFRRADAVNECEAVTRSGSASDPLSLWCEYYVTVAIGDTNLDGAMRRLEGLRSAAEATGAPVLLSRVLWYRGIVEVSQGKYEAALASFDRAREICVRTLQLESVSYLQLMRAEAFNQLGSEVRAAEARVDALRDREQVRSPYRRFGILLSTAQELRASGLVRASREVLLEARALATAVPAAGELEWRIEWAQQAEVLEPGSGLGNLSDAEAILARIDDLSLQARLAAEVKIVRGELATPGPPGTTSELTLSGIEAARGRQAWFRLPRLERNHAILLRAEGGRARAVESLSRGLDAFERSLAADRLLGLTALEEAVELYSTAVEMAVAGDEGDCRALAVVERFNRQVENAPDRWALTPKWWRAIPPSAAIVAFFPADEGGWAFVVTAMGCQTVRLPRIQLTADRQMDQEAWREALLKPIIPSLAGADRVVVIPGPSLHEVSFFGLRGQRRIWAAEVALSLAPSISFAMRKATVAPLANALIIADPDTQGRFPRLRAAVGEALGVSGLFERSRTLRGAQATRSAMLHGLRDADVFYLATHAVLSESRPAQSRIVLSGSDGDDLRAMDIERMAVRPGSVAFLAACDTAKTAGKGEGEYSIARSLLRAGFSAVIGSTRPVIDGLETQEFAALLRLMKTRGLRPSTALRERLSQGSAAGPGSIALYAPIFM